MSNQKPPTLSVREPIADVEKRLNLVDFLDALKGPNTPYEAFQIARQNYKEQHVGAGA